MPQTPELSLQDIPMLTILLKVLDYLTAILRRVWLRIFYGALTLLRCFMGLVIISSRAPNKKERDGDRFRR